MHAGRCLFKNLKSYLIYIVICQIAGFRVGVSCTLRLRQRVCENRSRLSETVLGLKSCISLQKFLETDSYSWFPAQPAQPRCCGRIFAELVSHVYRAGAGSLT